MLTGWPDCIWFWRNALHIPVKWITQSQQLSGLVAKAALLLVPLQYFLLTQFPGGFETDDLVATIIFQLLCVVALFLTSSLFGSVVFAWDLLLKRRKIPYHARVRAWSVALFTCWGLTVILLCISYMIGRHFFDKHADIVGHFLCLEYGCPRGYPREDIPTLIAYFAYSLIAAVFIRALPLILNQVKIAVTVNQKSSFDDPNLLAIVLTNTVLIWLLYPLAT